MKSINPATEEVLKEFETATDKEIEQALQNSVDAFKFQKTQDFETRAKKLNKAADLLEEKKEEYGKILTQEMGKPIKQAVAEVEKCAWVYRYYAENAEDFLADEAVETDKKRSYIAYQPIGPVLAVMPWNFPFWQVFRFAAPSLMAGNTGILKHASNVPQSALAIEEILKDAGFKNYEFQTLLIGSDKIEKILKDDRIRAATLTGSEGAGSAVASTAGEKIKKTVLELGGSDAFIVMPSADMDNAVEMAVKGRIQNNGQSCIAAKRFIVHADVYDIFRDRFVEAFKGLKTGDPMDEDNDVGPLAMLDNVDDIEKQVQETVKKGAKILVGCEKTEGKGYFYTPGIIENIPEGSSAYEDELFGPVASLFKVGSLDEAIDLANDSKFGLGSAIFTTEKSDMDKAVKELDAGGTFINTITASDPRLPFGGVKASGYGRELARFGIHEFVNIKTVVEV